MDYQSIVFGQKHPNFNYDDFNVIEKVKMLAKKHQRLAESSCNGVGWIRGVCYYTGQIDDYAKRQYGKGVQSAYYVGEGETIFDVESAKIEGKIKTLVMCHNRVNNQETQSPFKVEFQGDPRGSTVKLYYEDSYIEL